MKETIHSSIVLTATAFTFVLAGCGSNATTATSATAATSAGKVVSLVGTAIAVPNGAVLYASNCAACHGAITASAKIGADPTRIQNAIAGNVGGMSSFSTLTAADIQAIATALAPVTTGAALYKSNCMVCHGGLSTTLKAGANITRIQNAITANTGGMGSLSTLAPLQVQAIAAALTAVPAGTALYASNCVGCHGAIATSTKIGADFSRLHNAINNNTGGMGFLSTLTASDIQAITAVLTAP